MRVIDAGATHSRQETSSPTPSAHPTAALTGETWVTITVVRSTGEPAEATSSSAARTRSPRWWSDSPPGGAKSTSERHSAQTDLSKKAEGYGIPGRRIDGMDVMAVRESVAEGVRLAREERRPTLIEAFTYRYRGHSMSDPAKYRTKEEVDKVRTEHDPIEQVRKRLLDRKLASEDELKKIDASVRATVNEASEFATQDPEPDPSELYTDMYR